MVDDSEAKLKEIRFNYVKSTQFRVIHADGMWGGITPNLNINIAFFNERLPIPQQTVFTLEPQTLGPEKLELRVTKQGVIREVETNVIMNLATAKTLITWLGEKVDEIEKLQKKQNEG